MRPKKPCYPTWCWGPAAELDLLLAWPGGELWAIEVKRSLTPKVERGFHAACGDLLPVRKLLVYPGTEPFPLTHDITAMPLAALCQQLASMAHPAQ